MKVILSSIGESDVGSDDRWGSPNRAGFEDVDGEDMDYHIGEGGGYPQNPFQFQHPFQHHGMLPPQPGMTGRGRGIPSFWPNYGGFGPPGGLGTPFRPPASTQPPRPSTAPPGSQSEMVHTYVLNS